MANSRVNKRRSNKAKLHRRIMREKLAVMIIIILLAFAGLCVQLVRITDGNQAEYQKKILSQQRYDSTTLPFKRGTITDANGTILAVSEKVYNVVLDCKVMLDNKKNQAPTVDALVECFKLDRAELDKYIKEHPTSQYHVLKKRQTYDEISPFLEREKTYKDALASRDATRLISIIKTLYLRKKERSDAGKKNTAVDERYFKLAENQLHAELAFALGEEKQNIQQIIIDHITN